MWNEDYKDILHALSAEQVDFILIGAYALAAHGLPRATIDVDIWVQPSSGNARKVHAALLAFGAPMREISVADFAEEGTVFQIGVAPRRIDILTGISGVNYEEAIEEAIVTKVEGIQINILSMKHLIANKMSTGRLKDLDDVQRLQELVKRSDAKTISDITPNIDLKFASG